MVVDVVLGDGCMGVGLDVVWQVVSVRYSVIVSGMMVDLERIMSVFV